MTVPPGSTPAAPPDTLRCPSCGAYSRAADWCGLCWADLRPVTASDDGRSPEPHHEAPPVHDPLTAPLAGLAGPAPEAARSDIPTAALAGTTADESLIGTGWPCTACGVTNDLQLSSCHACGRPFLAAATSDSPVVGRAWGRLLSLSRGQRLVAGLVAGLLGTALLLALMAVLGLVL